MSARIDTLTAPRVCGWPRAAALALALLAMVTALFWPTFHSMVEVWERSETFTHGFLIFPISAWLIWTRRAELRRVAPRADWRALPVLALAGAVWLLADAGSVNVVAQYALIAMLVAAVWAVLGECVVRTVFFPLMFLFLAVPVGEFLIPPLMNFTADFTVTALQLTGVPVYREGTFFSIPSGDWSVVEGCSGLRYLIASITLGTLYAYLTYRSWQRRVLFTLAAFIVPVLANGGRAYMIVMIAHLSNMQLALGVDHYIYGWVFFGLVMLLLFWIGSFWREDEAAPPAAPPTRIEAMQRDTPPRDARNPAATALAALLIAAIWPAYGLWLERRALPPMPALAVAVAPAWQRTSAFTDWVPHWVGHDRQFRAAYRRGAARVLLEVDYYATQRQDAELINSQNFMVRQKHPLWSQVGDSVVNVTVGGRPRTVRQAQLKSRNGARILVWQWNSIDGRASINDAYIKLILAADRLHLARDDGASILVATPYDAHPDEAAAVLARFIEDNEGAIEHALQRVGGR